MSSAPRAPRSPAPVRQSLDKFDLFSVIDEAARQAYEKRCVWQWWESGAQILDLDGASDDVYFVVHGRARVMNYSHSGSREVALGEITEGGCFGELAAIDGEPRSANVVAMGRTLTARLSGTLFVEFLLSHPDAALAMMRRLTEIIRLANARVMDLSTLAAQNRIYADLLRQARTGGGLPPNAAMIRPIPRHHAIAARASTTRETVARVLGDLARRELVRREGDALLIIDVRTLGGLVEQFRT
jgi:CRP/FNR family cyclic AMP-dependent transcriptional regulator